MFIGEIIKKYRIDNNLSQRAFASKTSLSPSYINTLEKIYDSRTRKPISVTIDAAKEIAKAMQMTLDSLLPLLENGQEFKFNERIDNLENSIAPIPLLEIVKADYDYLAQKNWIGTVDVDKKLAESGEFFALQVHGDSMSPVIIEDDIVIVKRQDDFETGDIVVAIVNGDEATIKRGKKSNNSILLQPLNPNYEPLIFTYDEVKKLPVTIVGIVKQLKRNF